VKARLAHYKAPKRETVCALGNRKNDVFNEVIARDGIEPYPGSVAVLELLRRLDVPAAIVSSSKNARTVLTAAGLGDRFEYVVDGVVAAAEHLAGKPAPDMFLRGAELLGVDPARTAVVEDAVSGVAAAAAGGFALVIGVDRGGHAEELRAHGAEVIVADLADTLPADPPVDHGGSPA
jgi:HAD superfamily hydrolase (TIGR01509 family)